MSSGPCLDGWAWAPVMEAGRAVPSSWQAWFASQTLAQVRVVGEYAYEVFCDGLPEGVEPGVSRTVLEELAWALLSRPECDVVVRPLYVSLESDRPLRVGRYGAEDVEAIAAGGFLAMCRQETSAKVGHVRGAADALRAIVARGIPLGMFSRALLQEKTAFRRSGESSPVGGAGPVHWLKRHLTAGQKDWLRRRLRVLLPSRFGAEQGPPDPQVAVRVPQPTDRIPVWIALHWLELGGAEKFALDLIRALPKDRYAVYVTTDVPSENPWAGALEDEVEELIHLPSFLPPHAIEAFCIHYARTRRPRLLHVNHAPRVYESLPRVRRALPELVVLDTLHIVELAAYGGGYPEWAMANFRTFIDHHHVVSRHLKRFLMERWQIPEGDIDVIFANVDGAWFDPAAVPAGTVRRAHGIPDDALVVGFVGRFTRQKRPLEFVRMAGLLHERWRRETGGRPELHFVMAGGGELLEEVRASIRVAGLGRVLHLHGEVADTRPVYRDCDLIAMPSENEGLALVAYEAMAMATPVFFTDVGAQSELLPREQLVPDEMPVAPALARALWPYLLDGEKRRRTGEVERGRVLEHHRLDQTRADVRRLYERLLGVAAAHPRDAIAAKREGGVS